MLAARQYGMILVLLGLVVFTCERNFLRFTLKERLSDLVKKGWPAWKFSLGGSPGHTLGELIYHLRNGVAHARLMYSSDSRDPGEVAVTIEDADWKTKQVYWRASLSAADRLKFCYLYAEHVDDVIG